MKTRLLRLCAAALVAVGFAATVPRASADTVDSLNLTWTGGGNSFNNGGPFTWKQTTPINSNFATSFSTYCIDISHNIRSGPFVTHTDLTQAPTIGNDALKVAAINTLFDHFYSSSFTNSTTEAAFQLALWELVYDGPNNINLSGGTIQTTNATLKADALGLLNGASWNGTEHDLANAHLVALVPDASKPLNQAQLLVQPNPKGVPAPPAALLAGVGVLALVGRARWTRKKAPTA